MLDITYMIFETLYQPAVMEIKALAGKRLILVGKIGPMDNFAKLLSIQQLREGLAMIQKPFYVPIPSSCSYQPETMRIWKQAAEEWERKKIYLLLASDRKSPPD
jgi:hypothetical protein